jgi:type I restriction-modification system DNA methylase subunit
MANVRETLNSIWAHFRKAGIADDLSTIEHIAFLMTEDFTCPLENLRPRKPSKALDTSYLKDLLNIAAEAAGGRGELFNQYILFRLPSMLPGGRYPTPRHIADFITQILGFDADHSVADFACGSGGFLVNLSQQGITRVAGCEISPEWARLAWANLTLHGWHDFRIEIGNAVSVCFGQGPFSQESFDRILMNPSFGETVDVALAERSIGSKVGSRSETVLLYVALEKLANNGQAAVLTPSGLLFSGSAPEKEVRRRLVDEMNLQTIISLPKDAFQPYSSLQTHLVLLKKSESEPPHQTWFLRAEQDGYPPGRSRDLTQKPNPESDLPFITAVINSKKRRWSKRLPARKSLLGIKVLRNENQQKIGFVVGAIGNSILTRMELFASSPDEPKERTISFLLVSVMEADRGASVTARLTLETGKTEIVDSRSDYVDRLRKRLKIRSQDPDPCTVLIREDSGARMAAVDRSGRLLGVGIERGSIQKFDYDLRPEQYIKIPEVERPRQDPALLLANIRKNEKALLERIDSLLSRLDMPSIAAEKIPPPVWVESDGEPAKPFGTLSEDQKAVWDRICKNVEGREGDTKGYQTPKHFVREAVEAGEEPEMRASTQATLGLFEKMGLIIPVMVVDPASERELSCYRLASERDRWPDEEEEPEMERGRT